MIYDVPQFNTELNQNIRSILKWAIFQISSQVGVYKSKNYYTQLGQTRLTHLKSEEKILLTSHRMYHSLDESSQLNFY
jgi:hypothetical protein